MLLDQILRPKVDLMAEATLLAELDSTKDSTETRQHFTEVEKKELVERTKNNPQATVIHDFEMEEKKRGGTRVLHPSALSGWKTKLTASNTALKEHKRGPKDMLSKNDGAIVLRAWKADNESHSPIESDR